MMPAPIERIFIGWDAPALETAAGHLIDHYSTGGEARLDGALVVLPGGRAGRRLLELLVQEADARGVRLVPPRLTTIGKLPELLYRPELPLADPVLARRVWALALAGLDREVVTQLFPHPPDADDLRGWATLARLVERYHRELGGAGLRFRDLADRCRAGLIHDDPARWDALDLAATGYLARLDALGFSDRESARRAALEARALEAGADLWLVGVVEIPGIVRQMLRELRGKVRALVHAPADRADDFDDDGCVLPERWLEATILLDDAQLRIAERPADQAAAALDLLAALRGRFAADEITIGVPDEELVPYLEERFSDAGLPVRYAAGREVHRSGPYRLLEAIADYLDGRRFQDLATLLRHPDLWRWLRRHPGDEDETAEPRFASPDVYLGALDRYHTETLPARLAMGLAGSGRDRDVVSELVAALESPALLGALTGKRRLAEWAPELLRLLAEVYGDEPLDRGRPGDRHILEACEAIKGAAAAFHTLPREVDEPCAAVDAFRLILAEAAAAQIPPEADRAAIELLGWLELHLDDAPVLIVTGANEPHLPESVNADAFLPNSARARLGLVDNEFRFARDAYQLTAVLHSRPEVRLIAGRRDAAGDPLRPSRLLFAAPPLTVARRVRDFFDDDARPDATDDLRIATDGARTAASRFTLPPEPVIASPAPITRLRVTDFRALIADPYRFALERLLGLEPLDDAARELDPLRFGSLAHEILQRFGEGPAKDETDEAKLARHLDELLDAEADRRFGRHALPAVRIQREQLRARLRAFAAWQAARTASGWRILAVEAAPPDPGVPFDVDGEPIYLRGRIDRIDYHPETGEWALLDYKTGDKGESPERTHRAGRGNDKVWVDLQLPLYLHLLPEVRGVDGEPLTFAGEPSTPPGEPHKVRLGYVLLPRELGSVGDAMADWDEREIEDAVETAREVVRELRRTGYRFEFSDERLRSRTGDPLAPLLGVGQLAAAFDDDVETDQ